MFQIPNKPISIEFTADTDKYERGLKDAERATEKLADTLEKDVPRASEKMADKAEHDFDRIGDEAKEAGRETGKNFIGSLGEGLGSGDLSEVVQETLGEAVSGMAGPVGAAVGVVAGAGLLIWNKFREEAEKTQEAIATQTQSMWATVLSTIDTNTMSTFAKINKEQIINKEFMRLWEEDPEGMLKAQEAAAALGISAREIARAHAGDEEALARVNAIMDRNLETADLTTSESRDQIDAIREIQGEMHIAETVVGQVRAQTEGINAALGGAGVAAEILNREVRKIPSLIPVEVKFTATGDARNVANITGGAFAVTGGQLTPVYANRDPTKKSE